MKKAKNNKEKKSLVKNISPESMAKKNKEPKTLAQDKAIKIKSANKDEDKVTSVKTSVNKTNKASKIKSENKTNKAKATLTTTAKTTNKTKTILTKTTKSTNKDKANKASKTKSENKTIKAKATLTKTAPSANKDKAILTKTRINKTNKSNKTASETKTTKAKAVKKAVKKAILTKTTKSANKATLIKTTNKISKTKPKNKLAKATNKVILAKKVNKIKPENKTTSANETSLFSKNQNILWFDNITKQEKHAKVVQIKKRIQIEVDGKLTWVSSNNLRPEPCEENTVIDEIVLKEDTILDKPEENHDSPNNNVLKEDTILDKPEENHDSPNNNVLKEDTILDKPEENHDSPNNNALEENTVIDDNQTVSETTFAQNLNKTTPEINNNDKNTQEYLLEQVVHLTKTMQELQLQVKDAISERDKARAYRIDLENEKNEMRFEIGKLKTELSEKEKHMETQKVEFLEMKKRLGEQFSRANRNEFANKKLQDELDGYKVELDHTKQELDYTSSVKQYNQMEKLSLQEQIAEKSKHKIYIASDSLTAKRRQEDIDSGKPVSDNIEVIDVYALQEQLIRAAKEKYKDNPYIKVLKDTMRRKEENRMKESSQNNDLNDPETKNPK